MAGTPKSTNLDNKLNASGSYDAGQVTIVWAEDWNDLAATANQMYNGQFVNNAYFRGSVTFSGSVTLNNVNISGINQITINDPSTADAISEGLIMPTTSWGNVRFNTEDSVAGVSLKMSNASDQRFQIQNVSTGAFYLLMGDDMVEYPIYTQSGHTEKATIVVRESDSSTLFYNHEIGLALHNDDVTTGNWSPMLAFTTHETGATSTGNSVATAAISAQHQGRVGGSWSEGDLVFFVNNSNGLYEAARIHQEGQTQFLKIFLDYNGSNSYGFISSASQWHFSENAYYNGSWLSHKSGAGGAMILQSYLSGGYLLYVQYDSTVTAADQALSFTVPFYLTTGGILYVKPYATGTSLVLSSQATGAPANYITFADTGGDIIKIGSLNNGDDSLHIYTMNSANIYFGTLGSARAYFTTGGDFFPYANNTYDLGGSSNQWAIGYINTFYATGIYPRTGDNTGNVGGNGSAWGNMYAKIHQQITTSVDVQTVTSSGLIFAVTSSGKFKNIRKSIDLYDENYNWDKIYSLELKEYTPLENADDYKDKDGNINVLFGLIAEDVEYLDSRLAIYNDDGSVQGIKTRELQFYMLGAMQRLKQRFDDLENRLLKVEGRIDQ